MANAKKCDRCGNLYEHYTRVGYLPLNSIVTHLARLDGYGQETWTRSDKMDLCPNCGDALHDFLYGNDKKQNKEKANENKDS